MATKRNIARSGAMGKSFYQSTKSKRTCNHRHRASMARPPIHKNHKSRRRGSQGHLCPYQLFPKWKQLHVTKNHKEQEDAQPSASASASKARPPTQKNHKSTTGRADQSQKPHVTKNHKTNHTRTTQDPQRPKTRKVACRAGLTSIRHAKTTKTTRTTEPCGSSHACGYLGGYSPYFYIILYIYKSECE